MVELRTLGPLTLTGSDGQELHSILAQPKRLALLVYLATPTTRRPYRRDALLALFWPQLDHAHARGALRQATLFLRQALGEGVLVGRTDEELGVSEEALWCDVGAFDQACDAADWTEALDLYRGDFLEGFHIHDGSPELEQWIEGERARLRGRAVETAWSLADHCRAKGDDTAAAHWGQRALSLAPDDEMSLRRLVRLLDEVGDRSGALRAYEDFARRLARLYEVEPSPKTEALIQALQSREGLSTEVEPATTAAEDRISETTAREATDGKPSTSGRGMPKRRIAKTAIIATLAIAAVTAAAIVLLPRRGPALDEERVVVAIFENRTGDESLEPLGLMAADWITDGLARTGLLDVVPSPDALICCHALDVRAAAGEDVDRVRGLAEATGAGIVVWGAFYQEGDSLRLQAQIIDAAQRQLLIAPEPVSGLIESPSEAVRLLRQRVMGALGTLFDPRLPALGLGSGQPPTFDAYREYAEGVRLTIGWQLREALQHLHQAAALDSTFVQPALFAAPIHYILNEFPQADSITRVVDRQRARLLPSELAYLDFGLGYATGDLHSAAEAVRRQTEISSALFWQFNHIKSAVDVNRPRESLEVQAKFDAESVLLRGWWHYWHWPSQAHHMVGDYRRELQEARRARRQYPDLQPTLSFEVQALAALGRVGELNERLDEGLTLQPQWLFTYTYTMRTAALELRAHGRPDAALKVLDRAIRWHRGLPPDAAEDPFTRYELAQTAYLAGRWDEARAMFEDLTVDLPYSVRYKGAFPCRINYLGYLGALAARRGDREEAMRISGELYIIERHPVTARPRPVWQASIAALLGENERAVELLKGAFSNGLYFGTWLHVDPDFESLHDYPPFQELLQPKG